MTEEMSFEIDLWSGRNTTAGGADSFKEQKMSIPTVHCFEYFKVVGERRCLMDDGGDNEKWYEWERMSMTEVELWMIEWVGGENEIRFRTSGGVSALEMENLSVLHALMQSW